MHSITASFNESFPDFSFNYTTVGNVTEEKILGIVIDNKLNFKSHLKSICKKANQKLCTLSRISKLLTLNQRKKWYILSLTLNFLTVQRYGCLLQRVVK